MARKNKMDLKVPELKNVAFISTANSKDQWQAFVEKFKIVYTIAIIEIIILR